MEDKLTQRRFKGNENWLHSPPTKHTERTKSTRSLRLSPSTQSTQSNTLKTVGEDRESSPIIATKEKTVREKLEEIKERVRDTITDQYRRATQSGNDPYVKVSIKPSTANETMAFCTLPILGGGSSVDFHAEIDNGEHTFACGNDINALKQKYLKIEVFDKETGAQDRLIGTAHIILKHLNKTLDKTVFNFDVPLYSGVESNYQWSGTIDIEATFKRITMHQLLHLKNNNSDTNIKTTKKKGNRGRSATDAIMLQRMKTDFDDNNTAFATQHLQKEALAQHPQQAAKTSSAHIIQGLSVDFVLFISLVLSGTLFLGVMNVYEVDVQSEYMQQQFGTTLSLIDSFRFSIVTVTTVGYGDFYPQTAGGRVFGSFMIIFGVSLLARLLSTILDTAATNYEEARLRRITNRRSVTHDSINEFDEDDDGIITQYEFLKTMLVRRGDTDITVIDEIMHKFDEYDEDKSGEIEVEEIKQLIKRKQRIIAGAEEDEDEEEEEEEDIDRAIAQLETINNYCHDEKEEELDHEYAITIRVIGCDNLKEADELVAAEDSFWSFIKGWVGFMLYLLVGAAIFSLVEDAPYGDMLWFFVVTMCTVGYGDVNPKSKGGRILNAFFIAISVVLFVSTFSSTFDYIYARQEALIKQKASKKRSMDDMIKRFPVLANVLKKRNVKSNITKLETNHSNDDITNDTLTVLSIDDVDTAFENDNK